ncbi:protoporphyrinogen oxidase [soil metagenome]|nr:FAD-dependent oxidoreductase [Gemmatimonadota bacterium]
MSAAPRVAVIGAGPAGLTAAYQLQRQGVSVKVFEARPRIGGRTRTDVVDGYRVDTFAQLFGSMYTEFFRMLREVGAGHLAVQAPGRDALWRGGRAHEVVYGSITSMLASGALPMRTKLRMGTSYLPFLTRHAADLQMHALEGAADAGLDAESIAEWGERELGRDFVDLLVYPLLAAYYGVTPEQTGAALYHLLAHHGMNVTVYALRGGAGGFCDALAQSVRQGGGEVRTSAAVQRVEPESGGVRVSGDGWTEEFDAAVVCIPGPAVPEVVGGLTEAARAWFGGVRYQPLVSLALLLDRPAGVRYFGLSFPRGESQVVAAACVEENKAADLVPAGKGLLVVLPAPDAVSRFLDAEPRQVLNAVLPDLARAFPAVESALHRVKLYRWPEGGPVFYPGYLRHLQAFRRGEVEGDGRIAFGGDYLCVPSTEGSVLSGVRAASRLLQRLRSGVA